MSAIASRQATEPIQLADFRTEGIADCNVFPEPQSRFRRTVSLAAALAAGPAIGFVALRYQAGADAASTAIIALTFMGGLLSTWSPCGYSSLSLLRPGRHTSASLIRFLPTLLLHGAGYAVGAVVLGALLGTAGKAAGFSGYTAPTLLVLAAVSLLYGIHQLGFLRVPYPQRRAQVPHDARQRFPMWTVGGLYGFALGLNYLTYVQTPILYVTTAAAFIVGDVGQAILVFAAFNLGRFLPMSVNLLPVRDTTVQSWLARRQESAATLDGILLATAGGLLLTLVAV